MSSDAGESMEVYCDPSIIIPASRDDISDDSAGTVSMSLPSLPASPALPLPPPPADVAKQPYQFPADTDRLFDGPDLDSIRILLCVDKLHLIHKFWTMGGMNLMSRFRYQDKDLMESRYLQLCSLPIPLFVNCGSDEKRAQMMDDIRKERNRYSEPAPEAADGACQMPIRRTMQFCVESFVALLTLLNVTVVTTSFYNLKASLSHMQQHTLPALLQAAVPSSRIDVDLGCEYADGNGDSFMVFSRGASAFDRTSPWPPETNSSTVYPNRTRNASPFSAWQIADFDRLAFPISTFSDSVSHPCLGSVQREGGVSFSMFPPPNFLTLHPLLLDRPIAVKIHQSIIHQHKLLPSFKDRKYVYRHQNTARADIRHLDRYMEYETESQESLGNDVQFNRTQTAYRVEFSVSCNVSVLRADPSAQLQSLFTDCLRSVAMLSEPLMCSRVNRAAWAARRGALLDTLRATPFKTVPDPMDADKTILAPLHSARLASVRSLFGIADRYTCIEMRRMRSFEAIWRDDAVVTRVLGREAILEKREQALRKTWTLSVAMCKNNMELFDACRELHEHNFPYRFQEGRNPNERFLCYWMLPSQRSHCFDSPAELLIHAARTWINLGRPGRFWRPGKAQPTVTPIIQFEEAE